MHCLNFDNCASIRQLSSDNTYLKLHEHLPQQSQASLSVAIDHIISLDVHACLHALQVLQQQTWLLSDRLTTYAKLH